jgi:hypothetical protein
MKTAFGLGTGLPSGQRGAQLNPWAVLDKINKHNMAMKASIVRLGEEKCREVLAFIYIFSGSVLKTCLTI